MINESFLSAEQEKRFGKAITDYVLDGSQIPDEISKELKNLFNEKIVPFGRIRKNDNAELEYDYVSNGDWAKMIAGFFEERNDRLEQFKTKLENALQRTSDSKNKKNCFHKMKISVEKAIKQNKTELGVILESCVRVEK